MKPIYLFFAEGSEELEALGVVDILRRASLPVQIVSVTGAKEVAGSHGVHILADALIEEVNPSEAEMLILPGGLPGTYNLQACKPLCDALKAHAEKGGKLAAICAAPIVFGELGLLEGRKATCYPGFEERLLGAEYTANLAQVDGNIITGKGPAAVFAFGLALVESLCGKAQADALRSGMLYAEVEG